MLITNNVIDSVNPSLYPPPNANNYGILIAATESTDVVVCSNNIIRNRTYDILTQSAYCSVSAKVSRFNNKTESITSLYYALNQFPTDTIDGAAQVIARSSDASFQPNIRCINEEGTPAEVKLYQQSNSSYLIASNNLHIYSDGVDQVVVDSNVLRPGADNTKTLAMDHPDGQTFTPETGQSLRHQMSAKNNKPKTSRLLYCVLGARSTTNNLSLMMLSRKRRRRSLARWRNCPAR